MNMVSVVCPVYNEERYIENLLLSLLGQDYTGEMEILIVDGGSRDRTLEIIDGVKDSRVRLLHNPHRIASCALNIGVAESKGDIVMRVDAHCKYPPCYVRRLVEALDIYGASNAGAVCRTLPGADTMKAEGIALALSTPFGMGNSYFRIGSREVREVDTVPFGCFPRRLFDQIGEFDEELVRNQDDEFNGRIRRNGGKIILLPDLEVDYYSRPDFTTTWKMFYQYGIYKPLVGRKLGKPATLRQFVPPLFVCSLLLLTAGAMFNPWMLISMGVYMLMWLAGALYAPLGRYGADPRTLFAVMAYLTVHLAYGTGYIIGLMKIIGKRKISVGESR